MICHQALVSMASRLHIEGVHGTSASTLASLVLLDSLIVGWILFLLVKAINRSQRLASRGLDQLISEKSSENET